MIPYIDLIMLPHEAHFTNVINMFTSHNQSSYTHIVVYNSHVILITPISQLLSNIFNLFDTVNVLCVLLIDHHAYRHVVYIDSRP